MEITSTLKVQHEYAIGDFCSIKKGDMSQCSKRTYDLEEAVSTYGNNGSKSSRIHLPNLIGVYRRVQIVFNNPDATGEEKLVHDYASEPYEEFEVHPSLVQIGFNPEFINTDIISNYIGPESKRMLIFPFRNLKEGNNNLAKFSELTSKRYNEVLDGKAFSDEERRQYLVLIHELLKTDGLDKKCYEDMMKGNGVILF